MNKLIAVAITAIVVTLGLATPAHARPAGPLELFVHDAPRGTYEGTWAWSANGGTIKAAQPSVAYRELKAFGECYPETRPNGLTATNCNRPLVLSGAVEGRYWFAGSVGVAPVVGKGVVRVSQRDVDHYIRVVLEASNGRCVVFYIQRLS